MSHARDSPEIARQALSRDIDRTASLSGGGPRRGARLPGKDALGFPKAPVRFRQYGEQPELENIHSPAAQKLIACLNSCQRSSIWSRSVACKPAREKSEMVKLARTVPKARARLIVAAEKVPWVAR